HPETILPAVERDIPVRVLNTFAPDDTGTLIVAKATREHGICAVTLKKKCLYVSANGLTSQQTVDFFRDVAEYSGEFYAAALGESKCFAVVDAPTDTSILDRLYQLTPHIDVQDITLLCGVGIGLNGELAARFSEAISPFSPIAVLYGVSDVGLIALLPTESAEDALRAVHEIIG
ncbi:MAG: hypothetical protein HYZ54_13570, partial [Ignavibacteriae bacterium]|nr:hypothetical protein [Ignavibacteriota bacterium]